MQFGYCAISLLSDSPSFSQSFGDEHRHFGVVVALMRDVFVDVEVQFFHKFFGAERVYEIIVILMNCLHVHEVVIY